MANNSIVIQNWYVGTTYNMYDVTQGINISNTSYFSPTPYFSTIDSNVGNNPSGNFIYAINSYSRNQDLATINITTTGTHTSFARGSLYAITGLPDANMNATGMILNVTSSGASSLSLQFINPGPYVATSSTTLGAVNCPEPSWTTGFFWTPTYQSQWETKQLVITAQFEPMYQQRQPQGLTNNQTIWTLNFDNRTNTEIKGMAAFIQNLQGVYSTALLMPPNTLFNNPNLKYVLTGPKVSTAAYNQSNASVIAKQVFEY